jgi:hypothetical protein
MWSDEMKDMFVKLGIHATFQNFADYRKERNGTIVFCWFFQLLLV